MTEKRKGIFVFAIDEFKFPEDERAALHDVHFTLGRGETLGIVGKTGSGKTTILKLLLREFEGIQGKITYGEESIGDYKRKRLRESIGYVPQDHFLFSTTISENIAFTNTSASEEEYSKRRNWPISTKTYSASQRAMKQLSENGVFHYQAARNSVFPLRVP